MSITVWCDDSVQGRDLIHRLQMKGYVVEHVLTAAESPTVRDGNSYCWDYSNIFFRYHL